MVGRRVQRFVAGAWLTLAAVAAMPTYDAGVRLICVGPLVLALLLLFLLFLLPVTSVKSPASVAGVACVLGVAVRPAVVLRLVCGALSVLGAS
jgi:hypothetical protein